MMDTVRLKRMLRKAEITETRARIQDLVLMAAMSTWNTTRVR